MILKQKKTIILDKQNTSKDKINIMPIKNSKNKCYSEDEESQDSDSSQQEEKIVYKKPQVDRLDRFKPRKNITINLSTTQYQVVTDVAQDFGWRIQYNMNKGDWDVYWTDIPIDTDTLIKMHLFQKINYYPGIYMLARKNLLGMNLMNMRQKCPLQYNFFPQTWMLPQQYVEFRQFYQNKQKGKTRTYIVKPQADCQGRGIFLTRNIQDMQNGKHYVVQRYISKPYLLDGLKFDLRIYVLLGGTNPLRLYVYEDGLARFATERYAQPTNQNLIHQYMHLTNYAINKKNPRYIFNSSSANMGTGHKRSLKCVYEQLRKKGVNIQILKEKINDLIIKTIIVGLPLMAHQYKCCQPEDYSNNMCFHVLGFDIMLNNKEEPQLIQVNHTPSYATDTPLDYRIKYDLIKDTLKLMHITSKRKNILMNRARQVNKARLHAKKRLILDGSQRKKAVKEQQKLRDDYERKHLGGYSKIFPPAGFSPYESSHKEGQKSEGQKKYQKYMRLINQATKIHFADNTPVRMKLEEAEKKKQLQEDLKKIKQIQSRGTVIKGQIKNANSKCKIKRTNTTNVNSSELRNQVLRDQIQKQLQGNKVINTKRTKEAKQFEVLPVVEQDSNNEKILTQFNSNQMQNMHEQISEQRVYKNVSNKNTENISARCSIQFSETNLDSPRNDKIIHSQMKISYSGSTNTTKNEEKQRKHITNSWHKASSLHSKKINRINSTEKIQKNNLKDSAIFANNQITYKPVASKLLQIEKGLMQNKKFNRNPTAKSNELRSSTKFLNFSETVIERRSNEISETQNLNNYSTKQFLKKQFYPKFKPFISDAKKRKYSKEGQLPHIYQQTNVQYWQKTSQIAQRDRMKSVKTKNSKLLNIAVQDKEKLLTEKNKNEKNSLIGDHKNIQMAKIISRKINFSHLKSSGIKPKNNSKEIVQKLGFIMPNIYNLQINDQKSLENLQSIIGVVGKKSPNKSIFSS